MKKRRLHFFGECHHPGVLFLLIAAMGLLVVAPACAVLITGSEDVNDSRVSGEFGWNFSYTRSFDGTKVEKDVQIDFVFDVNSGLDIIDQTFWVFSAELAIEAQWNNKYSVRDNATGILYPALVDVTLLGPFNQTVTVWADGDGPPDYNDPGRTDMANWHVGDSGSVNSHEFGHMLGLYDEYTGGATDPVNPIIDNNSLMGLGALEPDPTMPERYYDQFRDYVAALNPTGNFSLVPEPATLLILAIGSLALLKRRRAA